MLAYILNFVYNFVEKSLKLLSFVATGGFDRRRRTPFFYAAPRNWHSQRGSEEEDNDQDVEDEGKVNTGYFSFACSHAALLQLQASMLSVVHFDQRLGARHAVCWSKLTF